MKASLSIYQLLWEEYLLIFYPHSQKYKALVLLYPHKLWVRAYAPQKEDLEVLLQDLKEKWSVKPVCCEAFLVIELRQIPIGARYLIYQGNVLIIEIDQINQLIIGFV